MTAGSPGSQHGFGQHAVCPMCGVDVEVVTPKSMDQFGTHMGPALADTAISPLALAAVDLGQIAVHADKEHVQALEQPCQILAPGAELDDVLNNQIVARSRQSGQAPVEAGEKPWAHLLPPAEWALRVTPSQHATGHQMIRRHMQERLGQCHLDRLRQG